jgi:hypothetical protein
MESALTNDDSNRARVVATSETPREGSDSGLCYGRSGRIETHSQRRAAFIASCWRATIHVMIDR